MGKKKKKIVKISKNSIYQARQKNVLKVRLAISNAKKWIFSYFAKKINSIFTTFYDKKVHSKYFLLHKAGRTWLHLKVTNLV